MFDIDLRHIRKALDRVVRPAFAEEILKRLITKLRASICGEMVPNRKASAFLENGRKRRLRHPAWIRFGRLFITPLKALMRAAIILFVDSGVLP